MRLKALLSTTLLALSLQAGAQAWLNDSTVMGAGYVNDVYYSLKNGTQKTVSNTDWHLAFLMVPQGPYGHVSVWANHVMGNVKVYSLHQKASVSFASLTAMDTVGKTGTALYNTDSSWNYGAFNRMSDPGNPYDYSWGSYDQQSHIVSGDSLYLIKVGTAGTPYKVWIQQYISTPIDSIKWKFRIAQLDGTGDTTIELRRKDFGNPLFAYYNATTRTAASREPDRNSWDLLFTRYTQASVTQGPVTLYNYPVTGVFSNQGVKVADVRGVAADTTHYQYYAYTQMLSEIGADWKTFNMSVNPPRYEVDTTITYFIKAVSSSEYWQLQFTAFNYTAGTSVFRKRMVYATNVSNVAPQLQAWYLAPNPAANTANLMIDAKEAASSAWIRVTDMAGRTVLQQPLQLVKGMNAYSLNTGSWAAGTYMVRVSNGQWQLHDKLVVAR